MEQFDVSNKNPTPDEPQRQSIPEIEMPDWLSASKDESAVPAPDVADPIPEENDSPAPGESKPLPADGLKEAIPGWMHKPAARHTQTQPEPSSQEIDFGTLIDESDLPTWIRRLNNDQIPPDAGDTQEEVAAEVSPETEDVQATQWAHRDESEQAAAARFVEYTKNENANGEDVVQRRTILAFGLIVLILLIIALAVYL